jgi:hypothetical protein
MLYDMYGAVASAAWQKWVPEILLGFKGGWLANKADNLTSFCEPIA